MPDANRCPHAHTTLIAKDADAEYVECRDCGAILEIGELAEPKAVPRPAADAEKIPGSDQSLADA